MESKKGKEIWHRNRLRNNVTWLTQENILHHRTAIGSEGAAADSTKIRFRANNNILYLSSQQPNYSRVLLYKQNTTQSQSAKPQEKQAKEINET